MTKGAKPSKKEQVLVRLLSPDTLSRRFGSQETPERPLKKTKKSGFTKKRNRSRRK